MISTTTWRIRLSPTGEIQWTMCSLCFILSRRPGVRFICRLFHDWWDKTPLKNRFSLNSQNLQYYPSLGYTQKRRPEFQVVLEIQLSPCYHDTPQCNYVICTFLLYFNNIITIILHKPTLPYTVGKLRISSVDFFNAECSRVYRFEATRLRPSSLSCGPC